MVVNPWPGLAGRQPCREGQAQLVAGHPRHRLGVTQQGMVFGRENPTKLDENGG